MTKLNSDVRYITKAKEVKSPKKEEYIIRYQVYRKHLLLGKGYMYKQPVKTEEEAIKIKTEALGKGYKNVEVRREVIDKREFGPHPF